jgi:preprotein translocase subunit YajC
MGNSFFLVWIVLIGFLFYFMMIKPQKKARSQQVDLLAHLEPGAQVRTTAQIFGTVTEVGEDWVVVETTPGTKIKFGKPAIVGIILPDDQDAADVPTPGGIGAAPSDALADTTVVDRPGAVSDAVPAAKDAAGGGEAVDANAETVAVDTAAKS